MQADDQVSEIHILDVLIVLAKNKRMILYTILICGILGLIISLLLPPIYTARARILPPQQNQNSGMNALLGQLGAMSGIAAGMAGLKNPNDLYVGMLESQTVADDLIARFNLKKRYNVSFNQDASIKLKSATNIINGKDGLITIEFEDKNPVVAANIANAYVDELKKLTGNLAVTDASQRRLFFEKQVGQAKQQLADAEEQLKRVQEQSGMLSLDSQVKASITGIAQVKASLAAKEVELQAMKVFATPENPDYQRLTSEISELRTQLNQLQEKSDDGILATKKIPEAGLEYARRLRDAKFAETVYELMLKQYELAKVDEAKNTSIVQQLDRAVAPERKSKPSRALIVISFILGGCLLGCIAAFVKEGVRRVKTDPSSRDKWAEVTFLLKIF